MLDLTPKMKKRLTKQVRKLVKRNGNEAASAYLIELVASFSNASKDKPKHTRRALSSEAVTSTTTQLQSQPKAKKRIATTNIPPQQ